MDLMRETNIDALVFKFKDANTNNIEYIWADSLANAEWLSNLKKSNKGSFFEEVGPTRSIFDVEVIPEGRKRTRQHTS